MFAPLPKGVCIADEYRYSNVCMAFDSVIKDDLGRAMHHFRSLIRNVLFPLIFYLSISQRTVKRLIYFTLVSTKLEFALSVKTMLILLANYLENFMNTSSPIKVYLQHLPNMFLPFFPLLGKLISLLYLRQRKDVPKRLCFKEDFAVKNLTKVELSIQRRKMTRVWWWALIASEEGLGFAHCKHSFMATPAE